jgi:hypothetical protein
MFTKELIEKEVKNVFGDGITVLVKHLPNYDATGIEIRIIDRTNCNKRPSVATIISGLEELQAINPIDVLRQRINIMYKDMKAFIEGKNE